MRLTDGEREVIAVQARRCFGSGATVTLFGSRVDDTRRGGDIDLLVRTDCRAEESFQCEK